MEAKSKREKERKNERERGRERKREQETGELGTIPSPRGACPAEGSQPSASLHGVGRGGVMVTWSHGDMVT